MKISNWTFLFPVSLYFMPNVWDICSFLLLQTIHNEHTCIELCTRVRALGLPGGASGKEPTRQCRRTKRCGFHPWVRKIPWRRAWQPTPVLLPGESHRQRSLGGYSHKESDMAKATWHAHIQKNKCKALSFLTCPLGIDCPLVDMGSIKCLEEFLSGLGSPTRV